MATRPIKIDIIGDDSKLKKTLKSSAGKLEGFGKSIAGFGIKAGAAFAATTAAVGVKAVTAFSDYESQLKEVMTLLPDAAEGTFDDISKQTKEFMKEFGVLPDEAIPALYQALSAGVDRENVFAFMETAQQAAKGGVTDLETAVDGITSVVNAYGSEVLSATEASDLMFTAVKLGKTDFSQLSKEVYKVAPLAASVGINFKEVTTSLANLTAQGTPTAVAATQMKAAMAELAKSGTKASSAFEDLTGMGLQQFLEEEGNFGSAMRIMKEGADEAGISVIDMFGSIEAGQAVLALTADGTKKYQETLGEMGSSAGATETAFNTMSTGLKDSFAKIKANLTVLAIDIGEKVAPLVEKASAFMLEAFQKLGPWIRKTKDTVLDFAKEVARKVTPTVEKFREIFSKVVDWVRTFIKENPKAALAALGVVVASIVVPAVLGLVAAFASLFSPVILIVGALAALAAGVVYAYENFETFRNVVNTVKDFMVYKVWPALKLVARNIVIAFFAVLHFFQKDFVPLVKRIVETVVQYWQAASKFFMEWVFPTVKAVFVGIMNVLKSFWDVIVQVYRLVRALFSGDFKQVWVEFRNLVWQVIEFIVDLFIKLPTRIYNASKKLVSKFNSIVSDFTVYLFNKILDLILAIPEQIAEFISGIAEDILTIGKRVGGWIIDGLISAVKAAAGAVLQAVKSIIPDVGSLVSGVAGSIGGAIKGLIPGLASGGIVTRPTLAVVGEAGPEAVIPLNQAGGMGTTINLTVNAGMGTDGTQVGQEIVTALQSWQRTNGSIPISTVSQ